jgi:hypothetical protein
MPANAVLRATSVLASGGEKNAEISILKRRVHPPVKRNSKTGFGRGWENVAAPKWQNPSLQPALEISALAAEIQMDWVLLYRALNLEM